LALDAAAADAISGELEDRQRRRERRAGRFALTRFAMLA